AEYREGFYDCSDCQVPLVKEPPPKDSPEPRPRVKLVSVLTSADPLRIAAFKSVLDEAGIRYVTKGEGLQDLFAAGRLGTGFNPIAGPVELEVESEYEHTAKDLLAQWDEFRC